MGLKEAQDNFIKAHRELVREMGHEVDRIAQAMATLDDQLLQQQNSLESKSKAHSQYELDLFRNLQAASKIHDEEVLQISQNMELMHKQKEQLSKSLKLLVQTSLVNLPAVTPHQGVKHSRADDARELQTGVIELCEEHAQQLQAQQPATFGPEPTFGGWVSINSPAAAPATAVKAESVTEVTVEAAVNAEEQTLGRPKDRKRARRKSGADCVMTPEQADGATTPGGRTPGTGRYFLRTRTTPERPAG